ncbi:MAG: carbohydrate ABC transporter permease [Spirochaetes bacterium]|nr:MAG: carbohydrate ABC transporter permease [Spirochaetota bacterium]
MAVVGRNGALHSTLNIFRVLVIFLILIFIAFPVVWILSTSLSQRISMFKLPPKLFTSFIIDNYKYIFSRMAITSWIFNSLIISAGTMVFSLIIGVPAGYAFSRIDFRGKKLLLVMILLTRALPTIVLVMPFRVIMQNIGLLGTRAAVILIDTVYNAAFTFWLMSGIFESIPSELEDSARIDGCNPVQAFLYIAIPLSKPGLVTSALFAFIFSWNDFLFALTLTSPDTTTLPLGMLSTFGILQQGWTYMAAMGVLAIFPVIILSLLLQKYYVSGLTFGGVK